MEEVAAAPVEVALKEEAAVVVPEEVEDRQASAEVVEDQKVSAEAVVGRAVIAEVGQAVLAGAVAARIVSAGAGAGAVLGAVSSKPQVATAAHRIVVRISIAGAIVTALETEICIAATAVVTGAIEEAMRASTEAATLTTHATLTILGGQTLG